MSDARVKTMLKSQLHAALAMLRSSIEACPADAWDGDRYRNRTWQVAYHALFFTHLYLCKDEAAFETWEEHQADCQYPDGIPGPADPASDLPVGPRPYSKEQILRYWAFCDAFVDPQIDDVDLARDESGFHWYPIPKLEHLLVNLRHIQHHAANIAERVRLEADVGVDWVGARRPR